MYIPKYFNAKELVSDVVYKYFSVRYGENFIYKFFDDEILQDLDTIRCEYGKPITINNWFTGGTYRESGLRTNLDSITVSNTKKNVPYCGGHNFAKGFDLKDLTDMNYIIENNKKLHACVCSLIQQKKLKKFRRVENLKSTPTWVHTDGFQTSTGGLEIF